MKMNRIVLIVEFVFTFESGQCLNLGRLQNY